MKKVALVTWAELPRLNDDDRLLRRELEALGAEAEPAVWSDPQVRWEDTDLALLRSTWDYHLRAAEFLAWADAVSTKTRLRNDAAVVRWNAHKGYLLELAKAAVPIAPTEIVAQGQSVQERLRWRAWEDAVLKPAVSAGAHKTRRVSAGDAEDVIADEEMLLQPYLPELGAGQETSLVFVNGRFTHAVTRESAMERGIEAADDGAPHDAAADEIALGRAALDLAPAPTLYARADMVRSAAFGLVLLELELIEPSLFFRHSPSGCRAMAEAVLGVLR